MIPANIRLVASGLVGLAVGVVIGLFLPWQIALLLGWSSAAITFLTQVALGVSGSDATQTKEMARREDLSNVGADLALIAAAATSLVGVGFVLNKAGQSQGLVKGLTTALAVLSVVLAWTTVQTIFTLRYAALFYADAIGGIDFGTQEAPDYHDFAYLAFTVGMTYQVSDTAVTARPIRRTVLRHSLLSFVFATAFIAVLINVVGGLL